MATKVVSSSYDDEDEDHYIDMDRVFDIRGMGSMQYSNAMSENMNMSVTPRRPTILAVAAIDFGTTYTGIAYSLVGDYNRDPLQINAKVWSSVNGIGVVSHKTPTVVLLKSDRTFVAFGYEAEEQYAELADNNAHYGYRYFRHFKMFLHGDEDLARDLEILDEQGHALPAMLVFAVCIKYLRDETMRTLKSKGDLVYADEVRWVLTMPAIWRDSAKQFMRESAEKAGIDGHNLVIALEPEAASIYTKESISQRKEDENGAAYLAPYDPGTTYMVVDLGGGTVDVTIRQVLENKTLKEVHQASGGTWGGMVVNKAFMDFLNKIVGTDVLAKLRLDHKADYLDLERSVEMKKRHLQGDKHGRINIQIPLSLMEVYEELNGGKKLTNRQVFETQVFGGKVDIKRGRLCVDKEIIASFFKPTVDKILDHLGELLTLPNASHLVDIILVGGFADSKIIQQTITARFEHKRVIIPEDAGQAVIKGAVLYGHDPNIVKERVSKYTYGTRALRYFMDGFDPVEKRTTIDGETYCIDCFGKIAEVGVAYAVGEGMETELSPVRGDLTTMSVSIYKSTKRDPRYVTDECCSYLGKIDVNMPDTSSGKRRQVKVKITFADTELLCEGIDETTNERTKVILDTLSRP